MKYLGVGLVVGLLMVLMVGMAQVAFAQGQSKTTIMLYTSMPTDIVSSLETAFEAKYPNIDLQFVRSGTGKIKTRIATEAEAGQIEADLIWVADFSYYEDLKEKGYLLKYESPEAKVIPGALKDPEGYYYGARIISEVIAYNTNLVTTPPQSWKDLLDPQWKDQIIIADATYSGAALVAMGALTTEYGLSYYRGLRANGTAVVSGHGGLTRSIASGEYMVGMTLDYMVRQQKAAGSPIDIVYPSDGAIAIPSPIAIVAATKRPEAAEKFVDYVLSAEGQKALVEMGSFIPVRPDVASPAGAPSLSQLVKNEMPVDYNYIRRNAEFLTQKFTEIMLAP